MYNFSLVILSFGLMIASIIGAPQNPTITTSTTGLDGGGGGVQVDVHVAINNRGGAGGSGGVGEPTFPGLASPLPLQGLPPPPPLPSNGPTTVELFDDPYYSGRSTTLSINGDGSCSNFESWWEDKPSSIRSTSTCVEFFRYRNCDNRSIKIGPGGDSTGNTLEGFNNDLRSAKRC